MTRDVPKPMVLVNGRPFLEYEITLLKQSGIDDLVLCIGYLGEKVEDYFGDGRRWGVRLRYSRDGPTLLGPAGALRRAEDLLEEHFFVTYADAYLRMDYGEMMKAAVDSGRLGAMAVYQNHDRYGTSDVVVDRGHVVRYNKKGRQEGMVWVNFGVTALARQALSLISEGTRVGEEEFYGELIRREELIAFIVDNRFYEIGTPASLREFEQFISGGT